MLAHVYLNEHPDSFSGYAPDHAAHLQYVTTLNLGQREGPTATDLLELVFQVCNGADPQSDVLWYDHDVRSLSVGDVVILDDADVDPECGPPVALAYSCDRAGWTQRDEIAPTLRAIL